jgi:hypothetical protein
MNTSIILRAGAPPVYNQKRGPKTGLNYTKTSNQGLFKGSLAADVMFTRLSKNTSMGHDTKDAERLKLKPSNPNYQHTLALSVTMQDILREISPEGDLKVLGYSKGMLRLAYKQGKGDPQFHGQFVINLNQGDSTPIFYTRPWDRPSHHPKWDAQKKVITKPDVLDMIPDDVYAHVFGHIFTVSYGEVQTDDLSQIKDAHVFANTPRTTHELRSAIKHTLTPEQDKDALHAIENLATACTMSQLLACLSEEQILRVYDAHALITTGDWDGLALGHPPADRLKGMHQDVMHVYNTFGTDKKAFLETKKLVSASCDYFHYLKNNTELSATPLGRLLSTIDEPRQLFSNFSIARAGCITPHEFLFQQLINYSYRDKNNRAYGNQDGITALKEAFDAVRPLLTTKNLKDYDAIEATALHTFQKAITNINMTFPIQDQYTEHLKSHLKIALEQGDPNYHLPHPEHDQNIQDLFQHGFDMQNPTAANVDGPWIMITPEGGILYGDTQKQLIDTMLLDDFLLQNIIQINPHVDMQAGWGHVITKQIALGQTIPSTTLEAYKTWQHGSLQSIENTNTMKQALQEEKASTKSLQADSSDTHTQQPPQTGHKH